MKKFIALMLIITCTVSALTVYGSEDNTEKNINLSASSDSFSDIERSENDVLNSMQKVLENDMLAFYIKDDEDLMALVNRKNNFIWWSSPINADCDSTATDALKYELKSSLTLSYHKQKDSTSLSLKSAKDADISYEISENSVMVTYNFQSADIKVPVEYSLGKDFLEVNISSDNIIENDDKLIHDLTAMNAFGAGAETENGYFTVPDGSGAVINFNNGKVNSKPYSAMVYGNDMTAVPETNIDTDKKQVNLPVYGIVKADNALLAVAHDGDENVSVNASVSQQSKTEYNKCFFSFIMRGCDSYYIGNEESPITVYENDEISNKNLSLRYYILNDENISYCDIAECYRNYLADEMNVTEKNCLESTDLYIDLYGGTMKKQSFLGIPVYKKNCFTSFSQAKKLIEDIDIENISVTYRNWTDDGITHKIDFSAKPSDILGGSKDFETLMKSIEDNNNILYPVSENITFSSGNGFNIFFSTAMRISGAYARISDYDYAYGVKDKFRKNFSLISPDFLNEIYSDISENYSSQNIKNISLGKSLSVLYGDYGKKNISRGDMQDIIENSLEILNSNFNSVLAEYPNAYALPYVDCITDVPLSSSKYDIFDYDIPFYQMVIHGVIPYSSTPVNSSPNPHTELIKAVSYGSALNYDLIYSDIYNLKDTEADTYFYSQYNNIYNNYQSVYEIMQSIKDCTITEYQPVENGFIIEYSNGISINTDNMNFSIFNKNF